MDTVLIILGCVGFGAIVISAYVFTVAARHYVTQDGQELHHADGPPGSKVVITRRSGDRRKGRPVNFPLVLNDNMVSRDRRHTPERRLDTT